MARLTQKQTLLVIAGATTVLCGGAGGGVHWANGLIEEQETQIKSKETDIEAGRKKIAKIPAVEERVIILRENVKNYITILPRAAELTAFTSKVQDFAVKSGIKIESFVPIRSNSAGGAFQKQSYQYRFKASLWRFMKFMNFFENYERFVSVRDFTLTKGEADKDGGDTIHTVRMTVETYVYNPKTSGKLTKIVNYNTKRKKLRPYIQAANGLSRGERYEFNGREGRRDIFVDPRSSADADPDGHFIATMVQQRRLIEDFGSRIASMKRIWDESTATDRTMFERIEMQRNVQLGVREIDVKIAEVIEQNIIRVPSLNSRWYKEVQLPFKELSRLVSRGGGTELKFFSKAEFETLITAIKDDLGQGELDASISKYNALQVRLAVPQGDPRYPLRKRIEGLIIRAKIAKEFSAIPLKISGVLVDERGKSGVIINGEVYEEGEYIDATLFVKSVKREAIEFVYRGFTLVKTL